MTYLIFLLGIIYFFYYLIYKYILVFGTSYIFWHIWHTVLCAGLVLVTPVAPFFRSIALGSCIISLVLLLYVIVFHYDVIEIIQSTFKKK